MTLVDSIATLERLVQQHDDNEPRYLVEREAHEDVRDGRAFYMDRYAQATYQRWYEQAYAEAQLKKALEP